MHGQPGAGCLAEREGCSGMVDVVMREDDPVDGVAIHILLRHKAKDSAKAAGISRVDDRRAVGTFIEVGMGAANARDPLDHGINYWPDGGGSAQLAGPPSDLKTNQTSRSKRADAQQEQRDGSSE